MSDTQQPESGQQAPGPDGHPVTEQKRRTITLTDRPPVTILEADWPVIASARDHDGQIECQANRRWGITVRQHEDGRFIVYATYSSQYQGEHGYRGGELVAPPGDDLPAVIRRVGERGEFSAHIIDECIADLPAEQL